MTAYVLLECPLCGERRPFDAADVSQGDLVDGIAAHVVSTHPATPAARAEGIIERAVEDAEPVDAPGLELRGWDRYEVLGEG